MFNKPKTLFLIDAFGALISAFMLGYVLVLFKDLIGLDNNTLYLLASFPCIFFCYSICCGLLIKNDWKPFLKSIAIANATYCIFSLCIIYYHFTELTAIGIGYFLTEIMIVLFIAIMEWKVAISYNNNIF